MKLSLKLKLTISYVLLSVFLIISLFIVSNYILQKKFQSYIIQSQENKNSNIVNLVTNEFGENGEPPEKDALENIGNTALSEGMVLMVNDSNGQQLFCMSDDYSEMCNNMIESMSAHMAGIYPDFNGKYEQKAYDIIKNNTKIGTVTLGFYGPFYYNEQDIQFLNVLNKILLGVAVLFLLIAAGLGYVMAKKISDPIKSVIDKTKQIEKGNYADRLTVDSNTNEISQLIHSVNTLADTLERQLLSKKRMARDYAHELRTPLAALQANLEAMIDGIWEPTTERLESCREEILRLTRMLADIDHIVKIENKSLLLEKTSFNLATVINQVILTFQPSIAAKNISLETELTACKVYFDQDKIIQVIVNLLSNAVKYTDDGGKIKIVLNKYKNKAAFVISDTGVGIASEDLPYIFEHLYRVDKSRTRNTGGSGIGLSVVKALVDAHGGTITVKSELHKGSEFTVILPIK